MCPGQSNRAGVELRGLPKERTTLTVFVSSSATPRSTSLCSTSVWPFLAAKWRAVFFSCQATRPPGSGRGRSQRGPNGQLGMVPTKGSSCLSQPSWRPRRSPADPGAAAIAQGRMLTPLPRHTLSLRLCAQPRWTRNSTTSSCPFSAARWKAVLSIWERNKPRVSAAGGAPNATIPGAAHSG